MSLLSFILDRVYANTHAHTQYSKTNQQACTGNKRKDTHANCQNREKVFSSSASLFLVCTYTYTHYTTKSTRTRTDEYLNEHISTSPFFLSH